MKKFKIIVFIAFFTCFIPTVKSEQFVTVQGKREYNTKLQITGTHTESSSTTSCRNSSSGSNDDSRGGGDNGGGGHRPGPGGGDQDPGPGGGGTSSNCNTTNSITTVNKNSSWQYLQSDESYTFNLSDIGIEAGDTYTIKYAVEAGGNGYCGSEYMTRQQGDTTNNYTMINTVSNASCESGRR